MSEIKLERVVSVSSEDKKFPAANLLGAPGSGKWKSASAGEKQLSVILQFNKPSKISSIHIGNEGSAFIEILVGKETASSEQDWKVLLVASSLMTPADARSNINLQKVRLFSSDSLSTALLNDSWDRAKLICTQPFNKTQPFGLSFISLMSDEENTDNGKAKSEQSSRKLGAFALKDDTDSDDPGSTAGGSLFSDRARLKASIPPATAAAAVRAAARDADLRVGIQKDSKRSSPVSKPKPTSKTPLKRTASPVESKTPKSKAAKSEPTKTATKLSPSATGNKEDKSHSSTPSTVPFKEMLKGVVFTLSGFRNPKRSDLREKLVEMGAKYSPDWDKKCTHLVCAYASTPKLSQVDGKGYIVTEDWILDSHKRKKKLPWRDYRLGRARTPPRAKEDDEKDRLAASKGGDDSGKTEASKTTNVKLDKADDRYAGSTDMDSDDDGKVAGGDKVMDATQVDSDATEIDSSMDTDDEIAAHMAKTTPKSKGKSPASGKAPVTKQSNDNEASTSGASSSAKRALPVLPDYLLDKVFFFYGNVEDRHTVYRYLHAYGGVVEEYMCDEVQFVITDDVWDDNFDSALSDNENIIFVKSKWIIDIHSQQKFIPHQKYAIVPS